MQRLSIAILMIAIVLFISCNNSRLNKALGLAGDNRAELEKVLAHYSENPGDSLKYKAACFLIENMPGHYTLVGTDAAYYRRLIDNDATGSFFSGKVLDISLPFYIPNIGTEREEDIAHISAEFLINHIDAAFDQLERYPWLSDFPVDNFLEYLLPYRFMQERLNFWRDSLKLNDELLGKIHFSNDIKYLPSKVAKHLNKFTSYPFHSSPLQDAVFGTVIKKDCYSLCIQELLECRKNGIPAAIDFIPAYGNRNGYHYWITHITPEVKIPDVRYASERKAPKIYRFTYAKYNEEYEHLAEYVPELFRNPFIRDVTSLYASTQDITVRNICPLPSSPEYAYLCVFNNLEWQPVAIGKYNRKRIGFEQMGEDMVYLPIAYDGEHPVALDYPFIVYRNGKTERLVPDTTVRQRLLLSRKYPATWQLNELIHEIDGGCWVASDTPDFEQADTIFTYSVRDGVIHTIHGQNTQPAYRYWRYRFQGKFPRIAEFMFFNEDRQITDIRSGDAFKELFDGDPLTFNTLIRDLAVEVDPDAVVTKIICIPRTDGNGIIPGNDYELLYYDLDGWQSLGHRAPKECLLEYDNIPTGALLWLRNHTIGIEERIFTVKNGEVKFW